MTATGRREESTAKSAISIGDITSAVSAIVGLAAFVYLLGGVVLALRLAFDHLPALGVVGQLPHDFLFSIGVTQVIFPALLLAALHGIVANVLDRDRLWHPVAWHEAKGNRYLRARHIAFAAIAPVEIVLPGAAIAMSKRDVPGWIPIVVLAVWAAIAGVTYFVHWAGRQSPRTGRWWPRFPQSPSAAAGGLVVITVVAGVAAYAGDDLTFGWLIAAWPVALVFVLGYLLLRGRVDDIRAEESRGKDALLRRVPAQVYRSLATLLLTTPALVIALAALPLTEATVCPVRAGDTTPTLPTTGLSGKFVGETSDRVYIGTAPQIVSIPEGQVAQVLIGGQPSEDDC